MFRRHLPVAYDVKSQLLKCRSDFSEEVLAGRCLIAALTGSSDLGCNVNW
jgi:hypothetical protein